MKLQDDLFEQIGDLDRTFADLETTFGAAKTVDLSKSFWDLSADDRNKVDLLAQRFAAFQDTLHKKTFRTVAMLEGESPQTPREQVDLMDKLGVLSADDWMNVVREVRNDLSHEYVSVRRTEIAKQMLETTPIVLEAFCKLKVFCANRGYIPKTKSKCRP